LIRADQRQREIARTDIKTERPQKHSLAWAPLSKHPRFYDNLSGLQNLKILSSMSVGCSKDRIAEVLDIVGLSGAKTIPSVSIPRYAATIGIGQALLPNPELIILDETDRRS